MKLLLLLGFVVLACASTNNIHAHTRENLHLAASKLQALNSGEAPLIPTRPVGLQAVNATACIDAWVQLASVLNSSCGEVALLYSANITGVNVSQIVHDQCVVVDSNNRTCQDKVTAAIVKFSEYCSGPGLNNIDPAQAALLNLWLTMAKIPCIQNNGQYCYPIFQANLAAFSSQLDAGADLTPELLDQVCIPCVNKVVNELAIWGIKDFVALSVQLKIACTKRSGQYCMPTFINATKIGPGDLDTQKLNLVCHECTRVIAYRLWIVNLLLGSEGNQTQREELQTFLALAGFICQKNNKGDYCYNLATTYDTSPMGDACSLQLISTTGCPGSNCQKEIQKFSKTLGCCFGTWFSWLDFAYLYNRTAYEEGFGQVSPTQLRGIVTGICLVDIPMGCAKQKLIVTWTVSNILADWYNNQANQAWFVNNFKQVIAYILSADPDTVVNVKTSYDANTGGVVVSVEITGFSDVDVNNYKQYLSDALQITDDSNSVLAGLKDQTPQGASQQNSISDPIVVSAQSVDVACVDTTCWACSLATPSFSLLALIALLLTYFN